MLQQAYAQSIIPKPREAQDIAQDIAQELAIYPLSTWLVHPGTIG